MTVMKEEVFTFTRARNRRQGTSPAGLGEPQAQLGGEAVGKSLYSGFCRKGKARQGGVSTWSGFHPSVRSGLSRWFPAG